jgi:L-ribulose-5-phosphate 3-epimerase UlaE
VILVESKIILIQKIQKKEIKKKTSTSFCRSNFSHFPWASTSMKQKALQLIDEGWELAEVLGVFLAQCGTGY